MKINIMYIVRWTREWSSSTQRMGARGDVPTEIYPSQRDVSVKTGCLQPDVTPERRGYIHLFCCSS